MGDEGRACSFSSVNYSHRKDNCLALVLPQKIISENVIKSFQIQVSKDETQTCVLALEGGWVLYSSQRTHNKMSSIIVSA